MKKNNPAGKIRMAAILSILFILISATSCTKTSSDVPGPNEVFIQGMAFTPATITVTAGTTVKWTNKDGVAHNVTSSSAGLFDSGSMGTGAVFSHQFSTAGSFGYTCTFHAGMTGTVIVN